MNIGLYNTSILSIWADRVPIRLVNRGPSFGLLVVLCLTLLNPLARGQNGANDYDKWVEFLYSADSSRQVIGAHQLLLAGARGQEKLATVLREESERTDLVLAILNAVSSGREAVLLDLTVACLDDERPAVSQAAAQACYALRDVEGVLTSLLEVFDEPSLHPKKKLRTISAIGHAKSFRAVGPLIDRLAASHGEESEALRVALVRITKLDFGLEATAWRSWWEGDPERGLPGHKEESREEVLEQIIDEGFGTKIEQIESGLADEMIALIDPDDLGELRRGMQSSLWKVRIHSAKNLGRLSGEQAVAALIEALAQENHRLVLAEIVRALGQTEGQGAGDAMSNLLRQAVRGPEPAGEEQAFLLQSLLEALGQLRVRSATGDVAQVALRPIFGPELRALATETLGLLGGDEALAVLLEMRTNEKEVEVLRRVAKALGRFGEEAVPALIEFLAHEDGGVRWYAADSLGRIADRQALEPLIDRLSDPVARVRNSAVVALSRLGGEEVVEPIGRRLTEDTDALVRRAAAEALGQLLSVESMERLVESQHDPDPEVRARAWVSLEGILGEHIDRLEATARRFLDLGHRPDRAAFLYQSLIQNAPDNGNALWSVGLAEALIDMGQPDLALKELDLVADVAPNDIGFWPTQLMRIRALAHLGSQEEAENALSALVGQPGYSDRAAEIQELEASIETIATASNTQRATAILARYDLDEAGQAQLVRDSGVGVILALKGLLEVEDPKRVFGVIKVLRHLSSKNFGFDVSISLADQSEILERWGAWILSQDQ